MEKEPLIALDFESSEEVDSFLHHFSQPLFVKVGMELYLQNGPEVIQRIKDKGHRIFLDLKLHDIPNTVGRAMQGLAKLEVDMINVHAAGGKDMMMRAMDGLERGSKGVVPKLIAVTQLTSTTESQMRQEQGISSTLVDSVKRYSILAKEAGLDGVVCSPYEADLVRKLCGDEFLRVTPGIRLPHGDHHDQKRVTTPCDARKLGSTHIVVGRSITKSSDAVQAYNEISKLWGLEHEKKYC
ncbi:orotidine 5'-phosphate decarboxylase [Bacillus coahuilensis m2-6]|uniref:Orotidine 5'-phosphate decarboxylase n=1 Tax=Bacillus coahuilensis p1.1.43 TaxID=1150625 RepID=A0A147K9C8_9BACI|nr:orotidine-5'-phosphate decarboxylase [Bacillus coahuilensis]KUP07045.1 orotidine 5'-phosphate decarboxylase [Bacillus coahuilensis p1.1.43]KUP08603.1 orotidine 5'-phosphate decarboxylase [Bacillus coahuilensis m2-6]